MTDTQAREIAVGALRTLGRSERGRQALHDFKALLDNGGDGLDDENWQALIILSQLAARGKCFAVEEQFSRHTAGP